MFAMDDYLERIWNGILSEQENLIIETFQELSDIVIPPVFTPSTKNIFELYHEMHKNKTPFLFVVNEYGDIIGLLTFEDIAEEIVGEIHTDDHPDEHLISRESDRKYLVSGRIDIEYFQEYFRNSLNHQELFHRHHLLPLMTLLLWIHL